MARHRDGDSLIGLRRQLYRVGLTRRVCLLQLKEHLAQYDAPVVVHHRHAKLRRITVVLAARCRMRQRRRVVGPVGVLAGLDRHRLAHAPVGRGERQRGPVKREICT